MFNTLIRIHPATKMLTLIWLAAMLQFMSMSALLCIGLITILPAALFQFQAFVGLLRKIRVLLLMIALVYAISTPGEYIFPELPLWLSISKEGLQHGAEQMLKMLVMLAGLSTLLGTTQRDEILSGLYLLLNPCRIVGWNTDQMLARIYLTLDYVEHIPSGSHIQTLSNVLSNASLHISAQVRLDDVRFEVISMRQLDKLICIFLLIALIAKLL